MRVGDWIVRRGGGLTRRTNSANPSVPAPASPAAHLRQVEALYGRWGLPACFRLPSFLGEGVDRMLDAAGYGAEGDTATLCAPIGELAPAPDPQVELSSAPSPEWLESKANLSDLSEEQADIYRRAVRRLAVPAGFAALRHEEEIAACAYGALHGRMLCLEGVVTARRHRGKGFGRRMLRTLLHWAEACGAESVCLQVEADNPAALALYRQLGFRTELYRYHYRRIQPPLGATRN